MYVGQLPKGIKVQCSLIPLTNEVSPQIFYTPQRGEAFIGNRTHAIVDRDNIAKQYKEGKNPEDFQSEAAGQNTNSYIASDPYLSPTYKEITNTRTQTTIVEASTVPPLQQIIPQPLTPPRIELNTVAGLSTLPTDTPGDFLLNTDTPAGPRV